MSSQATASSIPEQSWQNPFPKGHPLHDLYGRRVRNKQDLIIILDDYHARRGTGKTVASLQLAEGMDQTDEGVTWSQCSLEPEAIRNAYSQEPKRSGLVLDEGEVGASNRDAMSKVNKALREILSMGRIEEKYLIVNTPSIGFLDGDVRLLADVWITMLRKGLGLVHFLKRQPYAGQGKGKLLTEKNGLIEFKDIQRGHRLRDVYNKLTEEKEKRIAGEEGQGFVPREKYEEDLQKARENARRDERNENILSIMQHPEIAVTQTDLADAIGVSQTHVSDLTREAE